MLSTQIQNLIQWGGLAGSPSVEKLLDADMDAGILRPWHDPVTNKAYVTMFNKATKQSENRFVAHRNQISNATLPHEVWIMIDQNVTRAAQTRLRIVADLIGAGLTFAIPNAMGVPVLMTQRASRTGTAVVAMDPAMKGPNDRHIFDSVNIPLPVTFADWGFSARELAISRRGGLPLDVAMGEDQGRAVAEELEKMAIGNSSAYDQFTFGGGTIYGISDFPSRITFTITAPTAGGWVPSTLIGQLLSARQSLIGKKKYGPYVLYMAPAWARYLDQDYLSTTAGQTTTITLRERLLKIAGFSEIRELDTLGAVWDILILQMDTETVREIVGMPITTVMWEEQGGLAQSLKTMCIQVPQVRADYDGNCGIAHGSV
jgi:hypothetical protein